MSYNFLDLFSGIGGFALAAHWANVPINRHYFSDIEPYANQIYTQHYPDAIPLGDIRQIDTAALGLCGSNPWIVCGGFPCQDISTAGHQRGLQGERSGLWFEMLRIIRELRPKYAVLENVRALCSSGLDEVLRGLASSGYDAEWKVIRAHDTGLPHNRHRVWIVAYDSSLRYPGTGEPYPQGSDVADDHSFDAKAHGHRVWFDWPRVKAEWKILDEPIIRRRDDGLSGELYKTELKRIAALGNSIVPQIAASIFDRLMYLDNQRSPK